MQSGVFYAYFYLELKKMEQLSRSIKILIFKPLNRNSKNAISDMRNEINVGLMFILMKNTFDMNGYQFRHAGRF
ncbi:protein of unknown function [Tepidanaerobacter acetatoxydans Re1]|uniref:Uncharacterized protein n=1 Tax=Tepidanaerobacter acetatoxydans (strain DSM 21804 / JCM 16047 / Re1) TaxID=1209989 RepID=L0S4P6_TEPAE|nr:protein of unknown function [Tepidanaerobacter acetatoxydans Re1]